MMTTMTSEEQPQDDEYFRRMMASGLNELQDALQGVVALPQDDDHDFDTNKPRGNNNNQNSSTSFWLDHDNPADHHDNPTVTPYEDDDRYPFYNQNQNHNRTLTMMLRNPLHESRRRHLNTSPTTTTTMENHRPPAPYWDPSAPAFSRGYQQWPQEQAHPPSVQRHQARVQVAPGLSLRLRGAAETKEAIERDFYLPAMCLSCQLDMYCIQDASYVVCPRCRVVTPMEGMVEGFDGGVGLGFTHDALCRRQCEILYGGDSSSGGRNVGVGVVFRR